MGATTFNHQTYHDAYQPVFLPPPMPYGESFAYYQSPMLQYLPDVGVAEHGNIGYFSDYSQLNRTNNFVNDLMNHENEIYQSSTAPHISLQRADQPYDRSTKMQSFVAAQQAMAKTGKTVLHNPFLQKGIPSTEHKGYGLNDLPDTCLHDSSTSISTTGDSPTELEHQSQLAWPTGQEAKPPRWTMPMSKPDPNPIKRPKAVTKIPKKLVRGKVEDYPAIVRALERRDEPAVVRPSLKCDLESPYKAFGWPANGKSYTRLSFPVDDDFGTDSWCELRPPTHASREKTKKVLSTIAVDMDTRDDRDMTGSHSVVLGDDARKWLRTATDCQSERRETIDKTVEHYMMDHALKAHGFGIIGGPVRNSENLKFNTGAAKALANVMAIVDDYAEEGCRRNGQKAFVPVPDHAIDHWVPHDSSFRSMFDDSRFSKGFTGSNEMADKAQSRGCEATERAKSRTSLNLW